MARKNRNARKVYRIDYARFARETGLNPIQRVKVYKFFKPFLRYNEQYDVSKKDE
jgi:hypothetical protein